MDDNQNEKLGDLRDLVNNQFEKYYKPSDRVANYIESLLKADECNNKDKRSEIISKLKPNILLLSIWKFHSRGIY